MEDFLLASTLYPRLVRRFQAILIDGLLIAYTGFGLIIALSYLPFLSGEARACIVILIVVLFEPVMVSATGGSVGHHLLGIRVRHVDRDRRISFFAAFFRFLIKLPGGWADLLLIMTTKRRQALHDLLARSVVVHKLDLNVPSYEFVNGMTRREEHLRYSRRWSRLGIIAIYWIVIFTIWEIAMALLLSKSCRSGVCQKAEAVITLSSFLALIIASIVVTIFGWSGHLYGCRRQRSALDSEWNRS